MTERLDKETPQQKPLSAASKMLPEKRRRRTTGRAEEALETIHPRTRRPTGSSQASNVNQPDCQMVEGLLILVNNSLADASTSRPPRNKADGVSIEGSESLMVTQQVKAAPEKEVDIDMNDNDKPDTLPAKVELPVKTQYVVPQDAQATVGPASGDAKELEVTLAFP
jgi:hypothetical protein